MTELAAGLEAAIAGNSLDEVTFSLPWMARAFAVTLVASRAAYFTLADFQLGLIDKIKASEARGVPIVGEEDYYTCWLDALTELLQHKTPMTFSELDAAEVRVHDRLVALQHDHEHHHHAHDAHAVEPVYKEEGTCR